MRTMAAIPILIAALALTLALIGCTPDEATESDQPAAEPGERVETTEQQTPIEDSAQEPDRETRLVEQRREQLREAMREQRKAAQETAPPDMPRRSLMRRDRDQTPWWQDEAMIAQLGLEGEQLEAIEQATADHRRAQASARQEMAELRRQMSRGLEEGDRDRATAATDDRDRIRQQLEQADQQWERTMVEILYPEQLDQLESDHPDALTAPRNHRGSR